MQAVTRATWRALGAVAIMVFTLMSCTPEGAGEGQLRVVTDPELPAEVTVGDVAESDGTIEALSLPAGEHEVCFGPVQGYVTPECETVEVEADETVTVVGEYELAEAAEPEPDPEPSDEVSHGTELRPGHVGLAGFEEELTPSEPIVTDHDGQVIEGLEITAEGRDAAAVTVEHDDVVIRHNRILHRDGATGIRVEEDSEGVVIEFNELDAVELSDTAVGHLSEDDGESRNNNVGQRSMTVQGPHALVRRNYIAFTRSGIQVRGSDAEVVENYVNRLARDDAKDAEGDYLNSPEGKALHGTSISMPGDAEDVLVARNRAYAGSSGGIILYAEDGPNQDVRIEDNLVVGNDYGFGIYGGRTHDQDNFRENEHIQIEGNRFVGRFSYPDVLGGGTNTGVDLNREGNTFEDNRWLGSSEELPARCGVTRDECQDDY